ncbi:MAG: hypothetical protein ACE5JQ_16670 [Candidatus Methylomirabilales bacterium]
MTVVGSGLDSVLLSTPILVEEATEPPFTFTLTIPNDAAGPLPILAVGKDRSGTFHRDRITITVQPTANLDSLIIGQSDRIFSGVTGFRDQITVRGVYSDGVKRDITAGDAGTTYVSDNPNVATVDDDGLLEIQGEGTATITVSNSGVSATVSVTVDAPQLPFRVFDINRAEVRSDRFEVEGSFVVDVTSNGTDVPNEAVRVAFGGFTETIPAGSFFRDDDDEGFQFGGASGGITRMDIRDDGGFRVKARDLDLSGIDTDAPVRFSLQVGFDYGERRISFDDRGRFRQ